MDWAQRFKKELNIRALRGFITSLCYQYGLHQKGYRVDGLLCDTITRSWERYEKYDVHKGSFQNWVSWWARSVCHQAYRKNAKEKNFTQLGLQDDFDWVGSGEHPTPEDEMLRRIEVQQEAYSAKRMVDQIESALRLDTIGQSTELRVFRIAHEILKTYNTVTHQQIANEMGDITRQGVTETFRRIRLICARYSLPSGQPTK